VTPDGIRDEDWDRVHELAVEIVNAGEGDEGDECTAELMSYLDRLEEKYGLLPSIVATRADYVAEPRESLALLEHAYELARERQDRKNMLYVASSLVSLQIDGFRNAEEAQKWLNALGEALKYTGDDSDIREHEKLTRALEQLRQAESKAG
jgi:hypothetical protein